MQRLRGRGEGDHDERDERPAVPLWTGRECPALRRALREKVEEFAARLGASDYLVYTWESRGRGEPPRPCGSDDGEEVT
jgi:DNA-binding transcriptional regulator YiaG